MSESIKLDVMRIPRSESLDPITVYFEDYEPGVGRVTIACYGDAWTAAWSAMSDRTVRQFIADVDSGYLSGSLLQLCGGNSRRRDYTARIAAAVIAATSANPAPPTSGDPCIECGADPGQKCYPDCVTQPTPADEPGADCPRVFRNGVLDLNLLAAAEAKAAQPRAAAQGGCRADYRRIAHSLYCELKCTGDPLCFLGESEATQAHWVEVVTRVVSHYTQPAGDLEDAARAGYDDGTGRVRDWSGQMSSTGATTWYGPDSNGGYYVQTVSGWFYANPQNVRGERGDA